jgi:hypothetical protein
MLLFLDNARKRARSEEPEFLCEIVSVRFVVWFEELAGMVSSKAVVGGLTELSNPGSRYR